MCLLSLGVSVQRQRTCACRLRHRVTRAVSRRSPLVNRPIRRKPSALPGIASAALLLFAWTSILWGRQASLPYNLMLSVDQLESLREAWNNRLPYIPGEVLVKFRDGVTAGQQVRAMSAVPSRIDDRRTRRIGNALLMKSVDEPDAQRLASTLQSQPEVLWAQPNYFRRLNWVPNDPGYARQWNFDLIGIPSAWDINNGASDKVVVAIVDTGVATVTRDFDFSLWTGIGIETVGVPFRVNPDLGSSRILTGRDFAFWTGPVLDMVGHGTHVAGTILQETNNEVGFAGIAHRALLMPLKACVGYWELQFALSASGVPGFVQPNETGGCTDAAVAEAIGFAADNGAQVVNLSLGGEYPSPMILEALQYAVGRGLFVSIAAGNEFAEGNPVIYPAKYAEELDGVVSVAAVGRSTRRAYYSTTGSYVELAAPGGDAQDGGMDGVIYQSSIFEQDFNPQRTIRPRFDRYAEAPSQGTSMAAPHISGVAALLRSQGLTTPAGIEGALESAARDLGARGRDDEFGYGLVDAPAALRGRAATVVR
jgi:serine protease